MLIVPQGFKGTAPAWVVAESIARGVLDEWPDALCVELPLADGGEGTVRALVRATRGDTRTSRVADPFGRPIDATWGMLGDGETAVVEMAAASGLARIAASARDPLRTSTRGTGELLLAAAASGARRIIVGIGDSATNDGGSGAARAIGFRFLDAGGIDLVEGGAALADLARVEGSLNADLAQVSIDIARDVRNPLLGPNGASHVFGPQKGASPDDVARLDDALSHYADVVERHIGRSVRDLPGAGAGGGLGFGLVALAGANLVSGAELILEKVDFLARLADADLVITGEGRLDRQSAFGKLTHTVTQAARSAGVPVAMVVGSADATLRDNPPGGVLVVAECSPGGPPPAGADIAATIVAAASRAARLMRERRGIASLQEDK